MSVAVLVRVSYKIYHHDRSPANYGILDIDIHLVILVFTAGAFGILTGLAVFSFSGASADSSSLRTSGIFRR